MCPAPQYGFEDEVRLIWARLNHRIWHEVGYSTTRMGRLEPLVFGRGSTVPTENRPGPARSVGKRRPISAKLYSKPPLLMKKPFLPCTMAMAPSMMIISEAAENRVRKPITRPI